MDDEYEVLLLLLVMQSQMKELVSEMESLLASHVREQRRLNRALPRDVDRVTWRAFVGKISDEHFRRMFRMHRPSFDKICAKISHHIGEDVFKSESYILQHHPGHRRLMAGEVKVAVSIRMLAGGSYLDLVPMFGV
jgi:hypothetical protein